MVGVGDPELIDGHSHMQFTSPSKGLSKKEGASWIVEMELSVEVVNDL